MPYLENSRGVIKTQGNMPEMEWKGEQLVGSRTEVTGETPIRSQGDSGAQPAVTSQKVKVQKLASPVTGLD